MTSGQTPFEAKYQLTPLGEDYEARARRAEAIAQTVLPLVLDAEASATAPMRDMDIEHAREITIRILDGYRDPADVEARRQWETAELDAELASG